MKKPRLQKAVKRGGRKAVGRWTRKKSTQQYGSEIRKLGIRESRLQRS